MKPSGPPLLVAGVAVAISFALVADAEAKGGICSQTADALFVACKASVQDDSFVKRGICLNVSDSHDRSDCFNELKADRADGNELCGEQHGWRIDACRLLGEGPYDPAIDPNNFESDFHTLAHPNPYFPLTIGDKWEYRGGGEVNTVEVMNQTKLIAGVNCVVFLDQVFRNGVLTEHTNDWYAQALNRDVWYFGEETADFETFDGDNPKIPELVNIDGSFKTGRDRDKPGIIFLASPRPKDVYLEEFSLGNAEDVTVVLSTTYSYGHSAELDELVPQALAERFCSAGDCVVTKDFSLLEPGIFARKYFARGVGVILEVEPDTQTVSQLVDCNFDPRCAGLPTP